jgi:hypothetical protein
VAQMISVQKAEEEGKHLSFDINPKVSYCKRNLIKSYLVTQNEYFESQKLDFIDRVTNYSTDDSEYNMFHPKKKSSIFREKSKVDPHLKFDTDKMYELLDKKQGDLYLTPGSETKFYCPEIERSCCMDSQMVELIQKYYNAKTYLLIFKKQLILLFNIVNKITRFDFNNLNNRFDLNDSNTFSPKCQILSKGEMLRKLHNIQNADNQKNVDIYFEKLLGKFYSFACNICNADKHSSFRNRHTRDDIKTSMLKVSQNTCVNYMRANKAKFEFYKSLQNIFKIINSINCIKEGEPVIGNFFEVDSSKKYVEYYEDCMDYFENEEDQTKNKNVLFRIKKYKCLAICQKFFKINYWKNTYGLKDSIFEALMMIQKYLRHNQDMDAIELYKYRNQQKLSKLLTSTTNASEINRVYFFSRIEKQGFDYDDFYGIQISRTGGLDLFKDQMFLHESVGLHALVVALFFFFVYIK